MPKPTILFITTDEQHVDTVYREDMPYQLPGLRALMGCSDVYETAYSASPVCLPARCTWMTGMMPHRNGCISNNFGASLSLQFPNLFTCLKKEGYVTSLHGKCHFVPCPYPAVRSYLLQDYETSKLYYRALGMDHLDLQDDKQVSLWYYDDYSAEMERKGKLKEYHERFMSKKVRGQLADYPYEKEAHPDSWTGQKALDYLDHCTADEAHFMWVSFSGPHYPMDAPNEYAEHIDMDRDIPRRWREGEWEDETKHNRMGYYGTGPCTEGAGHAVDGASKNYDEAYWRLWRKKYYANVVQIDEYIQKIIDKARGIWGENLYIVFTADHGDMMGNHSLWGKNSTLYNDVLRVPLMIHHPGQKARRNIAETVSSTEVFLTLLQMGGCELPQDIDGKPIDQMVQEGGRQVIFSSCEGRVSVVKGSMKLSVNGVGFEFKKGNKIYHELYDLEKDPYEFENRYYDPAYAQERDELEAILQNEPNLLRTVFHTEEDAPYWLNDGCGAGYSHNKL